ncbi:trehalose-phosphate synthase [Mycobacterium tuberculosis variant bovis BCG]|nr:trehalose-phosphate synthase [Mycobacterium tuberculosis variant bovis BCG]
MPQRSWRCPGAQRIHRAAAELRHAYLVNPHDLEGVKDGIEEALNQTEEAGRRRMRSLRRQVLAHDVDRWAQSFLDALAGHTRGPRLTVKPLPLASRRRIAHFGTKLGDSASARALEAGAAAQRL